MSDSLTLLEKDVLSLPARNRASLVEKLLASLAGEVDKATEDIHLKRVEERRRLVETGQAKLIDGNDGLKQARAALRDE